VPVIPASVTVLLVPAGLEATSRRAISDLTIAHFFIHRSFYIDGFSHVVRTVTAVPCPFSTAGDKNIDRLAAERRRRRMKRLVRGSLAEDS
jgi:hypothetical protein